MIILDYRDRRPIYEQVISRFQELMLTGALEKDSQLPSVRSLAMELSINPNTIQRAYAELERQGYIYSIKGKGSFVADNGHVKEAGRQEMLQRQEDLAKEACAMGVTKEQLWEQIARVYAENQSEAQKINNDENPIEDTGKNSMKSNTGSCDEASNDSCGSTGHNGSSNETEREA